jgi:hypothetical protein
MKCNLAGPALSGRLHFPHFRHLMVFMRGGIESEPGPVLITDPGARLRPHGHALAPGRNSG